MDRRNLLYMGAAAAAGLAGVGVAWLKYEPQKLTPVQTNAAQDALWALSFDTPDGQPQPMSNFRGKPLLLNFWATWCPPCVEELPLLDAFYQEQKAKGWQVLGLAVDQWVPLPQARRVRLPPLRELLPWLQQVVASSEAQRWI